MGEEKESRRVRRLNADKFLITRTLEDETTKENILKIHDEITKALDDAKKNLELIPTQVEERTKILSKDIDTLSRRLEAFRPFAERIREEEPKPEEAPKPEAPPVAAAPDPVPVNN